ncbi:hypothetical protein B7463_g6214, partial [Scytalidium lignicola]
MPHPIPVGGHRAFQHIKVKELHSTFGAEISGVDFASHVSEKVFAEILKAVNIYGVVVFRKTGLNDDGHVALGRRFGELDDVKPYIAAGRKNRLKHDELFDVSNLEIDGSLLKPDSARAFSCKGNSFFHSDSSFNPRRAGYSLLLAHELPPPETGGNTEFADTRTAFDDLPSNLKDDLLSKDYIAQHSQWHSRKLAAPDFYAQTEPLDYFMSRHRLVQKHEASGRMNLYIASHIHHLEGLERDNTLLAKLYEHAKQPKYVLTISWDSPGDLVIWDNTCTMHRSAGGTFAYTHRRDMRRVTVHDGSSLAWGFNDPTAERQGMPPLDAEKGTSSLVMVYL